MTLSEMQSQALAYKDQQIRDLVECLQLFYEQSFETATVAQLTDAYHLLNRHGCDVEHFTKEVV